jgi:hypothetical protein
MKLTIYCSLLAFALFLSGCGRPQSAAAPSDTLLPTPQGAGHDLADVLRNPPPPGKTVALDAYKWVGLGRQAGYGGLVLPANGCPRFLLLVS